MEIHAGTAARKSPEERVALVGTPNVGKSVIFGLLTGTYATVSNYPGTTVEVSRGNAVVHGRRLECIDTPGINSIVPMSEDEQVTRNILLAERPLTVLQVADSKNLARAILITLQMAELELPVILDLNMVDEARDRGIRLDTRALGRALGVEVVRTVAPERKGLAELRRALAGGAAAVPSAAVRYPKIIEDYAGRIAALLPPAAGPGRALALMVLSRDETLGPRLRCALEPAAIETVERLRGECERAFARPVGPAIHEARLRRAHELADAVTTRIAASPYPIMRILGTACTHPLWGAFALAAVLLGLYAFVGVLGAGVLVDLFEDGLFNGYVNPFLTSAVQLLVPTQFLRDMLVGPYGVITMALTYAFAIILPITATFFLAFGVLEDTGYLPRLAVMVDRIFQLMGLSGKAVLPMVLGLGCGTMAVLTTRVLETRRDRLIATFLLALAVPCAAQLGVIMGMLGGLSLTAFAIWFGCLGAVLLTAGRLAALVVPGESAGFILEIPPFRLPSARNVLLKTGHRVVWYLREAVPLFIYGTLALFLLDKARLLDTLQAAMAPIIMDFLDLPREATTAFLIGFLRRDYGAAGLHALRDQGMLDPVQTLVSLLTMTLFVPCLAHFLMMIKERGFKAAAFMFLIITVVAITAGGALNWALRALAIPLG